MIVRAVTIFRGAVSVAWLMKGTCGDRRETPENERDRGGRRSGWWQGGWWNRGKKKEERIKRRVPVVLPIDNGFHLYNSTPRATLDPFCLFSLMLFYHPFARCVPRVTYLSHAIHALALFSFAEILRLFFFFRQRKPLFSRLCSCLCLCYQRRLRLCLYSLRFVSTPIVSRCASFARNFASRFHRTPESAISCPNRSVRAFYRTTTSRLPRDI